MIQFDLRIFFKWVVQPWYLVIELPNFLGGIKFNAANAAPVILCIVWVGVISWGPSTFSPNTKTQGMFFFSESFCWEFYYTTFPDFQSDSARWFWNWMILFFGTNLANQLRLVVYPIIRKVLAPFQVVFEDFSTMNSTSLAFLLIGNTVSGQWWTTSQVGVSNGCSLNMSIFPKPEIPSCPSCFFRLHCQSNQRYTPEI